MRERVRENVEGEEKEENEIMRRERGKRRRKR